MQRDTGLVSLQIYIRKCITNHRPQHDDESVGLGAAIYQIQLKGNGNMYVDGTEPKNARGKTVRDRLELDWV